MRLSPLSMPAWTAAEPGRILVSSEAASTVVTTLALVVENEVRVIEYLSANTTIPLPRIRSWGTTEMSPRQLGPFIVMDFVEGVRLSKFLRKPTDDDRSPITCFNSLVSNSLKFGAVTISKTKDGKEGFYQATKRPPDNGHEHSSDIHWLSH
ncbi:hypothetical protein VTK26DRAFT_5739 [Humicola hyalothermophila]